MAKIITTLNRPRGPTVVQATPTSFPPSIPDPVRKLVTDDPHILLTIEGAGVIRINLSDASKNVLDNALDDLPVASHTDNGVIIPDQFDAIQALIDVGGVAGIESEIDDVQTNVNTVQSNVDGVQAELDATEATLSSLAATVSALATTIPSGFKADVIVADSGLKVVDGAIGSGWFIIGQFLYTASRYAAASTGTMTFVLRSVCQQSIAGLTSHIRLVKASDLSVVSGSSLTFGAAFSSPATVESSALTLVDGTVYFIQADALGVAGSNAFASIQAEVVARQVF